MVEILSSGLSIIKQHLVRSFPVAARTAQVLFVCHVTRVIDGASWPKANYTVTNPDVAVARKRVEYYCRRVTLLQGDVFSVVILDGHGLGSGTCNETATIMAVRSTGKYSGTL